MKHLLLVVISLLLLGRGWAQQPAFTLVVPDGPQAAGADAMIDLVILNPGAAAIEPEAPAELPGRLVAGGEIAPVVLHRASGAGRVWVGPQGFARVPYRFRIPERAMGRLVLEAEASVPLKAVIDLQSFAGSVAESEAGPTRPVEGGRGRAGLVPRAAASQIERTFREHFEPHEAVYFLYGPDHPGAKFQLSFKYRVLGDSTTDEPETTRNSLQFGYTQRSLWDITADSSPFVDTSYMPELFYEHLGPEPAEDAPPFTWLGFQLGYGHESNGKDEVNSRSLNMVFLRPAVALGRLGGWRMILAPRAFTYILDMSDNPDLKQYRGYGEVRLVLGRNDGPELGLTGRVGSGWDHATYQIDLSVPLRLSHGGFASYFHVQYFNGYAESLINYTKRTNSIRAGFSFVR